MKTLREQFEEDYAAVSIPLDNKMGFKIRYVYNAPWYLWNLPSTELKQKKILLTSLSFASLLLFLLSGLQETEANCSMTVGMAGTFALGLHVLEIFNVLRFYFSKCQTSRMTYVSVNRALRCIPLASSCCLTFAAVASSFFALRGNFQLKAIFVTGGYLTCGLMEWYIFKEYRDITFRTEKNLQVSELYTEINRQ